MKTVPNLVQHQLPLPQETREQPTRAVHHKGMHVQAVLALLDRTSVHSLQCFRRLAENMQVAVRSLLLFSHADMHISKYRALPVQCLHSHVSQRPTAICHAALRTVAHFQLQHSLYVNLLQYFHSRSSSVLQGGSRLGARSRQYQGCHHSLYTILCVVEPCCALNAYIYRPSSLIQE